MSYQHQKEQSAFYGPSMTYLENLYEDYLAGDHQHINIELQAYFASIARQNGQLDASHRVVINQFRQHGQHVAQAAVMVDSRFYVQAAEAIMQWYEHNGHYHAQTGMQSYASLHHEIPQFNWEDFHVSAEDIQQPLPQGMANNPSGASTLRDLQTRLVAALQSSIGYEFTHMRSMKEKTWWREQVHQSKSLSTQEQQHYCRLLIQAEQFEKYLARTYVGQKRFSLEGAENFIVALEQILTVSAQQRVEEVVLGMAHRGRLNTMVNTLGLSCSDIDSWFKGFKLIPDGISGDVKYHLGYSTDRLFVGKKMHISLSFNPSHLESIVPVTMGSARARQDLYDKDGKVHVLPILVHGDASFCGQGVVAESLNASYTQANDVGGSIHIVINNQIGFTTTPDQSRSSYYCTDFAKAIDAPILHVNGEDTEAVIRAAALAAAYRARFQKDVVVDIIAYRRHGHNEADEPSATNPLMYQSIKQTDSVVARYAKQLMDQQCLTQAQYQTVEQNVIAKIKAGERLVDIERDLVSKREQFWRDHRADDWQESCTTAVDETVIDALGKQLIRLPQGFSLQRQVQVMMQARQAMYQGETGLNWGAAEALCFASLLTEGYAVRLVGQDSCRGTFAHRHAIVFDQQNGESYCPCDALENKSQRFEVYNSTLSEFAIMGYEYGYSLSRPRSLVLWEAQFGDFANGAQVLIDQYLSSAWQKWGRMSGLVLLLPHGYEGQGPEHSSARVERYLQLCAQKNIQVCIPSTPAQYFHLLRRQMYRKFRAPLVVIMPKSLLRNPDAVSAKSELSQGEFALMKDDVSKPKPTSVKRVIVCSGKVYYDLLALQKQQGLVDTAICRMEQLYPFPKAVLTALLQRYAQASTIVWCQEEPENQGAWYVINARIKQCLQAGQQLMYAGRPKMAASAPGDVKQYTAQQTTLMNEAFTCDATQ